MSNKIKLIFGKNGEGKSFYYDRKKYDTKYISMNYDIENWYIDDKKIISQEKYLNKPISENIKNLREKLHNNNKKEFGKINKGNFDKFLRKINFTEIDDWYNFSTIKNNEESQSSFIDLFDIWEDFEKFQTIIKNLPLEKFEMLMIYSSFEFEKIDQLSTNDAKKMQIKLIELKKEIEKSLEGISEIENLKKIKPDVLDRIRNKELNIELITEIIKTKIVNLPDVQQIFKLKEEYIKNKKNSLNFSKYINKPKDIKLSKDGYSIIKVDLSKSKFSSGQKVLFVFETLMNYFSKSKKAIILDDVFEKLDIQNASILINIIFDEYIENKFNIEILTHDENLVNLFNTILESRDDIDESSMTEQIIYKEGNNEVKFKDSKLSLTFERYITNVYNSSLKENKIDEIVGDHLLFIKLFNRKLASNNMIQLLKIKDKVFSLKENLTIQIYEFLSENIFHYEKNIDLNEYPLIKDYFKDDLFINGQDTIDVYNNIIKHFENHKDEKYGINLNNVSEYMRCMLVYIRDEKEYFDLHKKESLELKNNKITKNEFYKKMEKNKNKSYKSERNKLFHDLEYSLTIINKK